MKGSSGGRHSVPGFYDGDGRNWPVSEIACFPEKTSARARELQNQFIKQYSVPPELFLN